MRMQKLNRYGFTLTELLIYIVLSSILIGFSLSVITTLAENYVNTREATNLQTSSRNVLSLMFRDISNMGYKIVKEVKDSSFIMRQLPGTWTGALVDTTLKTDSAASFIIKHGLPNDTLEIFKADVLDNDSLEGVFRISYVIDTGKILRRISRELDTATLVWQNPDSMIVANNVEVLQYRFTTDGVNWHDNPDGMRDLVRKIRIEILTFGNRDMKTTVDKTFTIGNVVFSTADSSRTHKRWRFYRETVEVSNNGNLM